MSFSTSLPIDVQLKEVKKDAPDSPWGGDGWVYRGGPYNSIIYLNKELAVAAIKRRFPAAVIDGKSVEELFPTVAPQPLPVPEPLPLPEHKLPPAVVPPGKTSNPHVYVAGKDGYCLLCDNAEGNPLHIPGGMPNPKRNTATSPALAAVEAAVPKVEETGTLW